MATAQVTQLSAPEGWIDFGIGQPNTDILPLEKLSKAALHRFQQADPSILQYGIQQGNGNFRNSLARFLSAEYDTTVDPDQLFITAGISQALDLICAIHTRPGDAVIVEEPSYFLALRIFKDYNLNIIGTPIDEGGLIIDALEKNLKKYKPVFIYTIPTFHNPSGVTLKTNRRKEMISLSEKYGAFIIADEVYQLLDYTSVPPLPLACYDTSERVLSLGSFSKILAPGLRLGWIQAKENLLKPFNVCGYLDSGGGLNPFVSSIVNSAIDLGLQKSYLTLLKDTYHRRMTVLIKALHENIPQLTFTDPKGGYFLWSRLPEGLDAEKLLTEGIKHKVAFQPGIKFSINKFFRNYIRLCFAFYKKEDLVEGVHRLSKMIM
jgi:2-aminoadipate transaminase